MRLTRSCMSHASLSFRGLPPKADSCRHRFSNRYRLWSLGFQLWDWSLDILPSPEGRKQNSPGLQPWENVADRLALKAERAADRQARFPSAMFKRLGRTPS